ncbi:MAG: CHAT domain-containing protein [Spirulinaceae cyanobacterium SM2_1_0]|nr:CHAT domain-containing protein [Spirulinaceae cyanobacterium SM2_1_0]
MPSCSISRTAVPMLFRDRSTATLLALGLAATLTGRSVLAQPVPASDATGTQVNLNGNQFDITGGTLSGDSANLFHSFSQFGLSTAEIANFLVDPQIQNILGRITGGDPSVINGLLQVTGGSANLYLMNPAGLVFGPGASLNVSGDFFATTATGIGFNNGQWFNAFGPNNFAALNGNPNQFAFDLAQSGSLINAGNLSVNPGQNLTLLGGTVANTGQLSAAGGQIIVAAIPGTGRVRISQPGQLLNLEILPPRDASGLLLPVSALDLPQLLTGSGLATGLVANADGTVNVAGSDLRVPLAAGTALIAGGLDVAAATTTGGNIDVLGDRLALINATLDASGRSGGNIRLGGDYLGQGDIPNAQQLFVDANANIFANAGDVGDGGRIILWSDDTTSFYGNISARGGNVAGDGGFVEVSGKQDLIFRGEVDLLAPNGNRGTLFLDPENITIVNGGGGTNDGLLPTIFSGTAPGADFTLSETALEALLGTTNVTLQATNDITINDLADNTLTFVAGPVGGGGGVISFVAGNNFTMLDLNDTLSAAHRDLTITAGSAIATGDINLSGAAGVGGDLTMTAGNSIRTGNINTSVNATFGTPLGGDVTLTTTSLGSSIRFTTIDTRAPGVATGISGAVNINARGTVLGTGGGIAINTLSPLGTSGTISITHDGGPTNAPFVVGGAAVNGTVGTIQGVNLLAGGTFPVLPNGGVAAGTPGGITIVSVNSPPTVNPFATVAIAPGLTLNFSFADLAAQIVDPDLDNLTLTINPITDRGTFAVNGVPVAGTVTLNPGDVLTFTADSGVFGNLDLFAVGADDVVSNSNIENVPAVGSSLGTCPPFCGDEVESNELTALADEGDELLERQLLSNFCRPEGDRPVASIERLYSGQYSRFLQLAEAKTAVRRDRAAAQQILRQAKTATGRESGLIYLAFCPPEFLPSARDPLTGVLDGQPLSNAPVAIAQTLEDRESPAAPENQSDDDDRLVLVLVPPSGEPIRYETAATRAEVEAGAAQFRRMITNPRRSAGSYLPPAQQMYDWLLAPLTGDLQRLGIQHLIYVPDTGLRLIPLAAMHDGEEFAIADYSFSFVPSLSLTATEPARLEGLRVLAMGAEHFQELPSLPAVPIEVKAITEQLWSGKAYLDDEFTLPNLQAARREDTYGIVHLATHSDFQPGRPENSFIQLSDTRIRLDQLDRLELDLPTVELLVLSACQTALGDPSAELGFSGLAVAAGVKSSLGSLWYVSDGGTLVLMAAFYEQLRDAPYRADALRQAQLALLSGATKLEPGQVTQRGGAIALPPDVRLGSPDLSHPYYWSAFTLVGNPW